MNTILIIFFIIMFISFITGIIITIYEKNSSREVVSSNIEIDKSNIEITKKDAPEILPLPVIEPDKEEYDVPIIIGLYPEEKSEGLEII